MQLPTIKSDAAERNKIFNDFFNKKNGKNQQPCCRGYWWGEVLQVNLPPTIIKVTKNPLTKADLLSKKSITLEQPFGVKPTIMVIFFWILYQDHIIMTKVFIFFIFLHLINSTKMVKKEQNLHFRSKSHQCGSKKLENILTLCNSYKKKKKIFSSF